MKDKTMTCSACKAANPADATFCYHCRRPTKAVAANPAPKVKPAEPALEPVTGVRRSELGDRLDPVTPKAKPPETKAATPIVLGKRSTTAKKKKAKKKTTAATRKK